MKIFGLVVCLATVTAFTTVDPRSTSHRRTQPTHLYEGDGNPPPFGNWGAPAPAPVPQQQQPAPAYDYSSWGQPAAAAPAAPASPAYDYSSWGQPAAATTTVVEPASTPAPTPAAPVPVVVGGDPIATFQASQQAVVDEIKRAIPDLEVKPDFCWENQQIAGCAASLQAYDAPGAANVAWLASLTVDTKLCSLTIFNGPLTDVPHLLSRVSVTDDGHLELAVDARPRAYGAYEMVDADGNYPGPEELGRKAFEYSGARMDFFYKYGTDVVKELLNPAQFENATPLAAVSDFEGLTSGPLALNVRMPITDANIQAVAHVRDTLARTWLDWSLNPEQHRPGAPINTQYVYDTKFRQNCYGALLPVYSQLFGAADGQVVTMGESGPLDEAYVGGAS